jgi:putative transposase
VLFRMLLFVWAFILDLVAISRMASDEKDLEILLLCQQLRIVERKQHRGPYIPRWQKVPLVALFQRWQQAINRNHQALAVSLRLFKPATLVRWHRELVRLKWTLKRDQTVGGRPSTDPETEALVCRLARENTRWGYKRIVGELVRLGIRLNPSTVKNILKRNDIPPPRNEDRAAGGLSSTITSISCLLAISLP